MGRSLIDKPAFWSVDWYKEMKEKGFNDETIANHLCISLSVFNGWKRKIKLPKYAYTFSNAKRKQVGL